MYYKTLKKVAKAEGKKLKEYHPHSNYKEVINMYQNLKVARAREFEKSLHPFKCLGAKVEVKITCSNGETFYL